MAAVAEQATGGGVVQLVRSIRLGTCLFVALAGGAARALGSPLTVNFAGNLTFINDLLDLDQSVYVGAPFFGGYTFDSTGVTDFYANDSQVGLYGFGSSGQLWAQIGNYEFITYDLGVLTWNNTLAGDLYQPSSTTPFQAGGLQWSIMSIVLADWSSAALQSDALPTEIPELSDYPDQQSLLIHLPGDEVGIRGRLTSLTPEPSSLVLIAFGAIVVFRRKENRWVALRA